jgi:hypothetical protein
VVIASLNQILCKKNKRFVFWRQRCSACQAREAFGKVVIDFFLGQRRDIE